MKFKLIEEKENKKTLDLDEALGLKESYSSKMTREQLEDEIWDILSNCISHSIADTFYQETGLDPYFDSLDDYSDSELRAMVDDLNQKGYTDESFYEDQENSIDWEPGKYIVREGVSKNMSAEDIAKKHKVSVSKIKAQLAKGIKVEKEHTKDEKKAERIALDHLFEIPNYYDKLAKMEKSALKEDTIKQNGKWVNKGKEGTHGTFKTKKEVKESLQKNEISDFFDKAKRLGVTTVKELKDLLAQEESKGTTEKEKIDAYGDSVELGHDTLSNESLKEDLNKESLEQEIRKAIREHFKTWDDEDYEDMIGEYLVVEVEDQEDGRTKVEVRAELSYATLDNIADELNKIVQKYDKDAYFDHEDAGIINAFIDKNAQGKAIDEYSVSKDEKLQGVRLRDYRNTWSAVDHMEVNGVDYYMFENDTYGDETYYVVTPNINEGPFYETFDDIETCLRDEGVLEENLNEDLELEDEIYNAFGGQIPIEAIRERIKNYPGISYEDLYGMFADDMTDDNLDEKLIQGKSDKTLKKNIATEVKAGKNPKQAYAVAKSIQDKHMKESLIPFDGLKFGDIVSIKNSLEPKHKYQFIGREKTSQEYLFRDLQTDEIVRLANNAILVKESDEVRSTNESFEDEHLGEVIKDDEIVDYFDNSVHDEDIIEDDFDEKHIEELTKKAIEESKKHTKEVGTTITENKAISTPTQEIINESINSEEDVVMDYVSPNAVDPNMKPVEVDLNNL